MKIIKIGGGWAEVESANHKHRVNLSLLKGLKTGDYILAHGDMALNRLEKEDAEKILKLIKMNHNE